VVVIITGAHKALALQKCIEGGVNHMWTLSCLQMHPHPMIVVDEDATLELQVKTVKYFKSIEAVANECGFEQILPSAARTGAKRDSVVESLNSPKEKKAPDLLAAPELPANLSRASTPDLLPDSMSSRIDEAPLPSVTSKMEDSPFERMGSRVAPSLA